MKNEGRDNRIIGIGLKNEIGDQNCFLNVLIHFIYHTKELRSFFEGNIPNVYRNNWFIEIKVTFTKSETYNKIL